jgi:hypothetical protein
MDENQRGEHRQFVRREVVHDLARVLHVPALREVALHETLHRRHAARCRVAVEDLQIDARKMMVWIGIELSLKFRQRCRGCCFTGRVRVGLRPVESIDAWVGRFERTEHVIERPVLHHQDDDVLQPVQAKRHDAEAYLKRRAERSSD